MMNSTEARESAQRVIRGGKPFVPVEAVTRQAIVLELECAKCGTPKLVVLTPAHAEAGFRCDGCRHALLA